MPGNQPSPELTGVAALPHGKHVGVVAPHKLERLQIGTRGVSMNVNALCPEVMVVLDKDRQTALSSCQRAQSRLVSCQPGGRS